MNCTTTFNAQGAVGYELAQVRAVPATMRTARSEFRDPRGALLVTPVSVASETRTPGAVFPVGIAS